MAKECLYAKYNRKRKRDFQIKTEIILDGDKKIACKSAIYPEAEAHVNNMLNTYEKYGDYYNRIKLVKSFSDESGIGCEYIEGENLVNIIKNKCKDNASIVEMFKMYLDIITDINSKYLTEFTVTENFEKIFGIVDGIEQIKGKAYTACNLDSIFDNYIQSGDSLIAFDYEWFFELVVPVDFIIFRVVKYFYNSNLYMSGKWSGYVEFAKEAGVDTQYFEIFEQMDKAFQEYVHGPNCESAYSDRYVKNTFYVENPYRLIMDYMNNSKQQNDIITNQNAQLEKYRRALHNPLYAVKYGFEKITKSKDNN